MYHYRCLVLPVLILLTCLSLLKTTDGYESVGPYEYIEIIEVSSYPPKCEDGPMKLEFSMKRDKDRRRIVSNWTIPFELNNNISVHIILEKWTNGWKPMWEHTYAQFCVDYYMSYPNTFNMFLEDMGLPGECPVPEGNYTGENFSTRLRLENFPELFYGKFRVYISTFQATECLGSMNIVVKIEP